MTTSVIMTYGDYNFSPVPFMRLGLTPNKTPNDEVVGFTWNGVLSGDLIAITGGILKINELREILSSAIYLQEQGQLFDVTCEGSPILSVYPRMGDVSFEQGNWVNRLPYTVNFDFDVLASGGPEVYIKDFSEEWSFEFVEDKSEFEWTLPDSTVEYLPFQARITHNISATGKTIYGSGGLVKPAYEQARQMVASRLGLDTNYIANSGIINFSPANFDAFNHARTVNVSETAGSYGVTETWLVISDSGNNRAGNATEDFTISVRDVADSPFRQVSIEGTVQGLETRSYGSVPGDFEIIESKYAAASGYWAEISDRMLQRCKQISSTELNVLPLSTSVSHNPYVGTIQYSYEYNDRPSNCLRYNDEPVKSESITLSDAGGTDAFASIFVLGRANGPVLQDLSTKTAYTRTLNIECTMRPQDVCPTGISQITTILTFEPDNINEVITSIEDHFDSLNKTYFKNEDSVGRDIKQGRYTRSVTWTFGNC